MPRDRVGLRASRWVVAGVGVLVIAVAGTALGVEITRGPVRHRAVASPSGRPEATVPGRRPAPGPLTFDGRRVAEMLSDPPGRLTMTSFRLPGEANLWDLSAFVLDPATGTFVATPYTEAAVSPDGRSVAGVVGPHGKPNQVAVRDRLTRVEHRVYLPSPSGYLRWAPRGRRVLRLLLGWYDDSHLLAVRTVDRVHWETALTDLDGTVRQVLVRDTLPRAGPGVMGQYSAIPRSWGPILPADRSVW
ncbi:hypothetical protein AB0L06_15045 [Spirillospora sp. NPDC052269]